MKLGLHGGLCCGVKTIYGFFDSPLLSLSAIGSSKPLNKDKYGNNFSTTESFFTGEAPYERYKDRLARYIAFCKKTRPQGMLEVILIVGDQTDPWEEILLDHGFKVYVPDWKNSNTGHTLRLYNLIYDEGPDKN